MTDRRTTLRSMFDTTGYGLEVGPSYNPLLPKADGFNVKTFDHADQQALVKKYSVVNDLTANIESVDYVSDGRPMAEVIGETAVFDFIFASHVIEHTTDLIGFLKDCEMLLKPAGVLVLAVPDKRFCFDYLKPLTSIGQVVLAHIEQRTRHTAATLFDHHFYHSARGGSTTWEKADHSPLSMLHDSPALANEVAGKQLNFPEYVDAHNWIFTPSSFRLIMKAIAEIGHIQMVEDQFRDTDSLEFYMTFRCGAAGNLQSYQELAVQALQEQAAALDTAPSPAEETASVPPEDEALSGNFLRLVISQGLRHCRSGFGV